MNKRKVGHVIIFLGIMHQAIRPHGLMDDGRSVIASRVLIWADVMWS